MYKLMSVNFPASFFLCRSYGSRRIQSNHYETLCIKNNASQKDIREAFIKLSKEHHPDVGNKGSHSRFVEVNEAYNILSKGCSRRQYDIDLKCNTVSAERGQTYYHHAQREYYNDPHVWGYRETGGARSEQDYHRMKWVNQLSNRKIALILAAAGLLLFSLQLMALRNSILRNQKYLKERSIESEKFYRESRSVAESMTKVEQLEALQNRFKYSQRQKNVDMNES